MKERGIIFSSDMVRAILDGRKTQTRSVIKEQPKYRAYLRKDAFYVGGFGYINATNTSALLAHLKCPYGKVGDKLYVRETWNWGKRYEDGFICFINNPGTSPIPDWAECFYKADNNTRVPRKWIPSSQMPKWATRIWLEITNIRAEKVQDISFTDCIAEGIDAERKSKEQIRSDFWRLWDSINAKRGYSWETSPWVWVITFKTSEQKGK